jgi:hypothetical protein
MRRAVVSAGLLVVVLFATTGVASADPVQHFGTFEVQCGNDVLELVGKPGLGAHAVAINGEPTNAVTVLMASSSPLRAWESWRSSTNRLARTTK